MLAGIIAGMNQIISNPNLNKSITANISHRAAKIVVSVLVALALLFVLGVICYVIYYAFRVKYLRPFFINSPKDLDAMLDEIYTYLNEAHETLSDSRVLPEMPFTLDKTLAFIGENVILNPNKNQEVQRRPYVYPKCSSTQGTLDGVERRDETPFEMYLFHDTAMDLTGFAAYFSGVQYDMMRQYSSCGNDINEGKRNVQQVIETVHQVQQELIEARGYFVSNKDAVPYDAGNVAENTRLSMCVHRLHYYLVLKIGELKLMAESRRFSVTNFFTITMSTFTRAIWHEQIVLRWKDMWGGADKKGGLLGAYRASYEKIGKSIDGIPGHTRQMMKDMVSGSGSGSGSSSSNSESKSPGDAGKEQIVMPEGWRAKMVNGDVLKSGEFLGPEKMGDKNLGALLKMQRDGDLVLYYKVGYAEMVEFARRDAEMMKKEGKDGNPRDWASVAWSTRTGGPRREEEKPYVTFKDDGDLVVYSKEGQDQQVLWSSRTGEGNDFGIRSAKGGNVAVTEMWDKPAMVIHDKDGKAIVACVNDGSHVLPHGDVNNGQGFKLDMPAGRIPANGLPVRMP